MTSIHAVFSAHIRKIRLNNTENNLKNLFRFSFVSYYFEGTLVMKCLMDYSNYPFDSQKCSVQMGSAAYTDEFMVYSGTVKYRVENQRDIQYKVIIKFEFHIK